MNIKKNLLLSVLLFSLAFESCATKVEPYSSGKIKVEGETKYMGVKSVSNGTVVVSIGKGGKYTATNWALIGVGSALMVAGAGLFALPGYGTGGWAGGSNNTYKGCMMNTAGKNCTTTKAPSDAGIVAGASLLGTGLILTIAGAVPHNNGPVYLETTIISKYGNKEIQYTEAKKGDNTVNTNIQDVAVVSIRLATKKEYIEGSKNGVMKVEGHTEVQSEDDIEYSKSLLIPAVLKGDKVLVKKLLSDGANPNEVDENGISAMMLAVKKGYADIAKLFFTYHADINAVDENNQTMLDYAMSTENENLKAIISAGYFLDAIYNQDVILVNDILKKYAINYNTTDALGKNGLHYVAENGNEEIAKLLLEKGININLRDLKGDTPLIIATQFGMTNLVKLFLKKHANKMTRNKDGKTALDIANENNDTIAIELLQDDAGDK